MQLHLFGFSRNESFLSMVEEDIGCQSLRVTTKKNESDICMGIMCPPPNRGCISFYIPSSHCRFSFPLMLSFKPYRRTRRATQAFLLPLCEKARKHRARRWWMNDLIAWRVLAPIAIACREYVSHGHILHNAASILGVAGQHRSSCRWSSLQVTSSDSDLLFRVSRNWRRKFFTTEQKSEKKIKEKLMALVWSLFVSLYYVLCFFFSFLFFFLL